MGKKVNTFMKKVDTYSDFFQVPYSMTQKGKPRAFFKQPYILSRIKGTFSRSSKQIKANYVCRQKKESAREFPIMVDITSIM